MRHCEERSDEPIQAFAAELDCFAPLAMTGQDYQRCHQQCFSGNSTGPLGRYWMTYLLAQRR